MSDNDTLPVVKTWFLPHNHNFGDMLTPLILRQYGIRAVAHDALATPPPKIIGIGSLMHAVPAPYIGAIWTTGLMFEEKRKDFYNTAVKVYALRGQHTLRRVSWKTKDTDTVVLGDGGLLISDVYKPPVDLRKKYKLGIMPHYQDKAVVSRNVPLIKRKDVLFINVQDGVEKICRQIMSCDRLLSSSLHGLIAADAYGVPSRQFRVSSSDTIAGGLFKFKDYYSIFPGLSFPEPFRLTGKTTLEEAISVCSKNSKRPQLPRIQENLRNATRRMVTNILKEETDSLAGNSQ